MVGSRKAIVLGIVKWRGLLFGAAAFLATHAVIMAKWTTWFAGDGRYDPWFLNAGTWAVATTVVGMFLASVVASALWAGRDDSLVYGVNVAVGAFAMMTVVLFTLRNGPGTIFPIVLAIGGWMVFVAAFTGALIVWPLKHALVSRET